MRDTCVDESSLDFRDESYAECEYAGHQSSRLPLLHCTFRLEHSKNPVHSSPLVSVIGTGSFFG
jgi:hypothetical protein